MLTKLLAGGGLAAALAASTCCIVPPALAMLGTGGGLLSSLTILAPYQTAFRVAAILMLGVAFWLVYRPQPVAVEGGACAATSPQGVTKAALWAGAAVMALVVTSGWWEQFVV